MAKRPKPKRPKPSELLRDDADLLERIAKASVIDPEALETLVERMLVGAWVDQAGTFHRFKFGGRAEREARYALVHLLGNLSRPLGWKLRMRLAEVIHPMPRSYGVKVMFGFGREGGPDERFKHMQIARELVRSYRASGSVAAAITEAAAKHGFDERHVRKIWKRYGLPRLTGLLGLPPPKRGRRRKPVNN
jgi:hypothetical protein